MISPSFNASAPPATIREAVQGLEHMSVEEAMFVLNIVVILVKDAKVKEEMTKLEGQNTRLKAINDALAALAKLKKEASPKGTDTVKNQLSANPGLEQEVNRCLRDAGLTNIFPGSGAIVNVERVERIVDEGSRHRGGQGGWVSLSGETIVGQMGVFERKVPGTFSGGISPSTKVSDLEAGIQKLQGESQLLGQTQQMTMVDLQSLIQELNAATEMGSSILRKWADLVSATLQKTG